MEKLRSQWCNNAEIGNSRKMLWPLEMEGHLDQKPGLSKGYYNHDWVCLLRTAWY